MSRNKKSPVSQNLANAYPLWSAIRNNEQSLGRQLINTISNALEDLDKQVENTGLNYFLNTANMEDMDIVFTMTLPGNYQFQLKNSNQQDFEFVSPVVSGCDLNDNWHQIVLASGNNVESFWYDHAPSRIEVSGYDIQNSIQDNDGNEIWTGLFTGQVIGSPYLIESGINLDFPGKVNIQVFSGNNFLENNGTNSVKRGMITMAGINRQGAYDQESLIVLNNGLKQSNKEWSRIDKITISDMTPEEFTTIRIMENKFEKIHNPQIPEEIDFYNLYESPDSREEMDSFWDIGENTVGTKVLQLSHWGAQERRDRLGGGIEFKQVVREWELYDKNNSLITDPLDLVFHPFSDNIWIVDSSKLYLFNNEWDIPNMQLLGSTKSDALAQIITPSFHATLGETVELQSSIMRPISEPARHMLTALSPSGTLYTVFNSSLITYNPAGWIYSKPKDRLRDLRAVDYIQLNERGDWVFTLKVDYANGLKDSHKIIMSVDSKTATAEFDLNLDPGFTPKGIDIDSDQRLWVLATSGSIAKKYEILRRYDRMLIDFERKTIFVRDRYKQLRVK